MPAYKDNNKNGQKPWYVSFYYKDWQGKRIKKMKRGFATKKEAQTWEMEYILEKSSDLSMNFESFVNLYQEDMKNRIKENTWITKDYIIRTKILPFFCDKKVNEIQAKDVVKWQNNLLEYENVHGEKYSPVYLKTVHNQLSAIFNHAIRYYDLKENPARKVGNMGKEKGKDIEFWTKSEYLAFLPGVSKNSTSYYALQMLYWCGLRVGELLALTENDLDFKENKLTVNKSYQRLKGKDIITSPKTEKSNRTVTVPTFLMDELKSYLSSQDPRDPKERLFRTSKASLREEMIRVSESTGVKRIKVHSLRHSHVSLLIEMGFSAVAIADRVGHESIDITYRYAHLFPSKQKEIADKLTMEL